MKKGSGPRGLKNLYYYLFIITFNLYYLPFIFFSKSLNTAIMSATIFSETAVALKENVTLMFSNLKQVSFSVFRYLPFTLQLLYDCSDIAV